MGTEEFWVPAVVGALSAGAQAVNTSNANKRAQNANTLSILDQEQKQSQANGLVNKATQQIAQSNPDQLKAAATGAFVKQLRTNAAGSTVTNPESALANPAGASSRYTSDAANGQVANQAYGNNLADELGTIQGATQQRVNEGVDLNNLATGLNGINAASQSQAFVDALRTQAAGQTSPWVALGSQLASNGANAYATNAGYNSIYQNPDGTLKYVNNSAATSIPIPQ